MFSFGGFILFVSSKLLREIRNALNSKGSLFGDWPEVWCRPGPRLNTKTVFLRYGDSHFKDKTVGETSMHIMQLPQHAHQTFTNNGITYFKQISNIHDNIYKLLQRHVPLIKSMILLVDTALKNCFKCHLIMSSPNGIEQTTIKSYMTVIFYFLFRCNII